MDSNSTTTQLLSQDELEKVFSVDIRGVKVGVKNHFFLFFIVRHTCIKFGTRIIHLKKNTKLFLEFFLLDLLKTRY